VLVLDEAVAALDPLVQKQILDLLKSIQQNTGVIYIFITHNPAAARYLCHQFLMLEGGIVVKAGIY
jgi:peptide/nickel transport system ATP-binding protein